MKSKRKIFNIYETMIFMLITTIVSSITCGFIMFRLYDSKEVKPNYSKITADKNLNEFIERYSNLLDGYYTDINKDELIQSAIEGMINYLGEKYTEYLPENESSDLLEQLEGEYQGIGLRIDQKEDGQVYVFEVFANTPAEEAGILKGDVFSKINDESVTGKTSEEISRQIKYGEGDTSKILFIRGNEEIEVTITRTSVIVPSVVDRVINYRRKNIGYMQIQTFSTKTPSQVNDALNRFKAQGIDKLIIDVRSNSGGYLDSVTEISEFFLEKDKIIYSIKTKNETSIIKDDTDEKTDFKIVVLVNEATASASEILAGALKESYGAILVGKKTYGKGKMQQTDPVTTGGIIKYTTGEWFLPSGENIEGIGLIPDHEVEFSETYQTNPTDENDSQLQKALETIIK